MPAQWFAVPHPRNPPGVVTISGGVAAVAAGNSAEPQKLLESADRALYRAKANGRNRVECAGRSRSAV